MTPHHPHPSPAAAQRQRGFTLIELMIVVAIVAILASVALPSYFDYVRRGQLPEAQAALSDFRVKMEQYYQDNRKYGGANCADAVPLVKWSFGDSRLKYDAAQFFAYTCQLNDLTGQSYTITATGNNGRAVGHVYTVDQNNTRATTMFKGTVVAKACWWIKGSEC